MKTCRADRVVVRDDRARCEHAGCCGNAGLAIEAADITLVSGSLTGW
jgi:hypothetical protein